MPGQPAATVSADRAGCGCPRAAAVALAAASAFAHAACAVPTQQLCWGAAAAGVFCWFPAQCLRQSHQPWRRRGACQLWYAHRQGRQPSWQARVWPARAGSEQQLLRRWWGRCHVTHGSGPWEWVQGVQHTHSSSSSSGSWWGWRQQHQQQQPQGWDSQQVAGPEDAAGAALYPRGATGAVVTRSRCLGRL
jgi:hypothetical protein